MNVPGNLECVMPDADKNQGGRPKSVSPRIAHVDVRLTATEKEALDLAAEALGFESTAAWAREALLKAADNRQAGLAEDIKQLSKDVERLRNLGQVAERLERMTDKIEAAGDLSREVRQAHRIFEAFKSIAEQLGPRRNPG